MIENIWLYYFSTMAQTIAAASALMIALLIIRLQFLSNSLNDIQHLIAEIFFRIAKSNEYHTITSSHDLSKDCDKYFLSLKQWIDSNQACFSTNIDYKTSYGFINSLIQQGNKMGLIKRRLHKALVYTFGGTILFSGISILAIPLARWISFPILLYTWIFSGLSLIILLALYFRVIIRTLSIK